MASDDHIRAFWNWLPHFRAIAETQHLPTAAQRVHVTPPALSRTLKLLEESVGHPLFHRRRGRLVLTADGERLLQATQRAMRVVDDAQRHLGGGEMSGPVRIATGGVSVPLVVDAALALRERYPGLEPQLSTPGSNLVDELWAGHLDLVVASYERHDDGLRTETLGFERSSIYCGPAHALFGRRDVTLDDVLAYPFVTPPPLPDGSRPEGWPAAVSRRVAMEVDRIAIGVDVCGRTDLLAVLPDYLAKASPVPLHRFPIDDLIPLTPIIAIRVESEPGSLVEVVVDEVRRRAPIPA